MLHSGHPGGDAHAPVRPRRRRAVSLAAALACCGAAAGPGAAQAALPAPYVDGPLTDSTQPFSCELATFNPSGERTGTLGTFSAQVRFRFYGPAGVVSGARVLAFDGARVAVTFPRGAAEQLATLAPALKSSIGADLAREGALGGWSLISGGLEAPPLVTAADGSFTASSSAAPITGAFEQLDYAPIQAAVVVHPGAVRVGFRRPDAPWNEVGPASASCTAANPAAVLTSVPVVDALPVAPPQIEGLGISRGATAGGTQVPIFATGGEVTKVTFGGVNAAFTSAGGPIIATAPPHAAAENVRVAITTKVSGKTSKDTARDDFDYIAPALPAGSVEATALTRCTVWDPVTGAPGVGSAHDLGLTLRAVLPATVPARGAVAPRGVRATVTLDPADRADDLSALIGLGSAIDDAQVTELRVGVTGAAQSSLALGLSADRADRLLIWNQRPIAWDVPAQGTLPDGPAATASASGRVGFTIGSFKVRGTIRYAQNPWDATPVELRCDPVGAPVSLGTVAVTAPSTLPAVARVFGTGQAASGGVALIQGSRFSRVTSVRFGTRAATFTRVVGTSLILAAAPPQAKGTYSVRVTTSAGTSPVTASATYTYR